MLHYGEQGAGRKDGCGGEGGLLVLFERPQNDGTLNCSSTPDVH